MSELDGARRERLVEVLRRGGQAVINATELAHVPGDEAGDVTRVAIGDDSPKGLASLGDVAGDDSPRGLASLGDVAQGAPSPAERKDDRAIGEAA
jgi:hypothetical protein